MSTRVKVIVAALCLAGAAVAAPFVWGYVTTWLKLSLDAGEDPYADVTVVHRQLPPSTVPDEWAARLEKQVGHDLGLQVRQDWRSAKGDGPWVGATAFQRKVAAVAALPAAPDYRVMGVLTNAADPDAVAAYGTIVLVWFQTPVDADSWVKAHPTVFTDPKAEAARTRWWAGFDVIDYAPPADGTDLTKAVDGWVRSVTGCPNGEQGCTVPDHIRTAGAKPTE